MDPQPQPQPQPQPHPSLFVFKGRLQEYALKSCYLAPVFNTTVEGPSDAPLFKSTVRVNNVLYESFPGFHTRNLAHHSAAEVALTELARCQEIPVIYVPPPVIRVPPEHKAGLCKDLLQEYAHKMNYTVPTYACKKDEISGNPHYTCIVEIGGIWYIGDVAKTKEEAEFKAARAALLAIKTSSNQRVAIKPNEETLYIVLPCKTKEPEPVTPKLEAVKARQSPKKSVKKSSFEAARTALPVIHTIPSQMVEKPDIESLDTVLPCKRKEPEPLTPKQEAVKTQKSKKRRVKKKPSFEAAKTALTVMQTIPSQMVEKPNEETMSAVLPCKGKGPEPVIPKQEAVKNGMAKKRPVKKKKPVDKKQQVAGGGAFLAESVDAVNTVLGREATNIVSAITIPSQMVEKPNEEIMSTVLPFKGKEPEPEPVIPEQEAVKTGMAEKKPVDKKDQVAGGGAFLVENVDAVNTALGREATNIVSAITIPSQIIEKPNEETMYTVLPFKGKEPEPVIPEQEAVKIGMEKKRPVKKKKPVDKKGQVAGGGAFLAESVDAVNTVLSCEVTNIVSASTNLGTEVMTLPSVNPNLGTEVMAPQDGR